MIITDPSLMLMPIDDRLINRSHGVFESITIRKKRLIKLDMHLKRLK